MNDTGSRFFWRTMSASDHKQTYAVQNAMSALPPIATQKQTCAKGHVCFTPNNGHVQCN